MRPRWCPSPDPHRRRTAGVLSLLHPHKKERAHGPITSHRPHHRRRRFRHRRGLSQCADHRAGEPAAADAAGPGRHRSRAAQPSDRAAKPRHLRAAGDRTTAPWRTSNFRSRPRTCGSSAADGPRPCRTSCDGRRRDSCCHTSRRAHHCRFVCSLNEQIFGMIEQGRSRGQSD